MRVEEYTGIKPAVIDSIREHARSNGLGRVVLFGSRARGTHRERSDIDLACTGGNFARFSVDLDEEAPTLLEFDFVNLDGPVRQELLQEIERDGVVLYEHEAA